MLVLNSPVNPTGTVFTAVDIAQIGALCRKLDLWIVSDECYREIYFDETAPPPE